MLGEGVPGIIIEQYIKTSGHQLNKIMLIKSFSMPIATFQFNQQKNFQNTFIFIDLKECFHDQLQFFYSEVLMSV